MAFWSSLVMHHDRDRTVLVCYTIAIPITLYVRHSVSDSLVQGQGLPVLEQALSWILLCNTFKCHLLLFLISNNSKTHCRFTIDTTTDWSVLSLASFDWHRHHVDTVLSALVIVLRGNLFRRSSRGVGHLDQIGGRHSGHGFLLDSTSALVFFPLSHVSLVLWTGQFGQSQQFRS